MVFSFLDQVSSDVDVRVASIELDAVTVEWLKAIGLEEGATVRVLRRAAFGGPLHVRSSTGSELAIHRSLARAVRVEHAPGLAKARSSGIHDSGEVPSLAHAAGESTA